jgi:hypothetical protein
MPIKRKWTEAEKFEMWGPGPWCREADRLEWRRHGLVCLMTRNPLLGNLCGYVGVAPGHPLHGVDRDQVSWLRVHGGVTYGAACDEERGVCHVAPPGEPDDLWWFGFDCLHHCDVSPMHAMYYGFRAEACDADMRYRDQAYVCNRIEGLADQLADAVKLGPRK